MKKVTKILLSAICLVAISLICACQYFLSYALSPNQRSNFNEENEYQIMKTDYPKISNWIDSIRPHLADTFITNHENIKLHARYAAAHDATPRTAIIIHGYKMNSLSMLHIAYLFHHDLNYNILLPDLQAHGLSDGDEIQMGWKDKDDIKQWIDVANNVFGGHTQMVITGISMGGATTMMTSGETLPQCVKCFVEDCGYTSVWDEFCGELDKQFHLPPFPLMHATNLLCGAEYGWTFTQASAVDQVAKCRLPMLFIHGDADTYVPTRMVYELYKAKAEPKEIYISKGSAHANSYKDHPDEYTRRVKNFVSKYID